MIITTELNPTFVETFMNLKPITPEKVEIVKSVFDGMTNSGYFTYSTESVCFPFAFTTNVDSLMNLEDTVDKDAVFVGEFANKMVFTLAEVPFIV